MTDKLTTTDENAGENKALRSIANQLGIKSLNIVTEKGRGIGVVEDKETCIIADYSGSTSDTLENGEAIYEVITRHLIKYPQYKKFYIYNSEITTTQPTYPAGGTPVAEALETAIKNNYTKVVLITDGQPNEVTYPEDMEAPDDVMRKVTKDLIEAAKKLFLNCIYVGPDNNIRAKKILEKLTAFGKGEFVAVNLNQETLADSLNQFLLSEKAGDDGSQNPIIL